MRKVGVSRELQEAKNLVIAVGTRRIKVPHCPYWRSFCDVWGVYTVTFGALGDNSKESIGLRLKQYMDDLAAFPEFIVYVPRNQEKR